MKSFLSLRFCFFGFVFWLGVFEVVAQEVDTGRYNLADTARANDLSEEADKLINSRDFEPAQLKLDTASQIFLATLGEESAEYALVLHRYGLIFYYQSKLDTAIACYIKASTIRKNVLGAEHFEVANSYNNLGSCYLSNGDYERAIEIHQEALAIRLKALGAEHPDVAKSYNNLGISFKNIGDYETALELHREALRIRLQALGNDHPATADSYTNMGNCFLLKGDYERAIEFQQKALEIRLNVLDARHPSIADSYNNLGNIFFEKGDYQKAIGFHQKALEIKINTWGSNHPEVAKSYINLSNSLADLGDDYKAIEYCQKGLATFIDFFGPEHPFIGEIYNNLGGCYWRQNDNDKAIEFYQKSLEIRLNALGGEHPDVASSYHNLGASFRNNHDLENAIKFFEIGLEKRLEALGLEHPDVSSSFINIGLCYADKGENEKAIEFYLKALTANRYEQGNFEKTLSLYFLIQSLEKIGLAYLSLNNKSGSGASLMNAYSSFQEAFNAIRYYRQKMEESNSRELISEHFYTVYESNLTASLRLFRQTDSIQFLSTIFSTMESFKALALYENLKAIKALSVSGIPDSLLQLEYDLRIDIAYYDKKRQEKLSEGATDTDSTVLAIGSKLFDLNRRYEALKSRFETDYPQYYKAKYDLSTISLAEVQKDLLQPNQSLLEYLVGDSNIYVYLVRKDTFFVREIKHDFPLDKLVREMTKDGIYGYHTLAQTDTLRTTERNKACISSYTNAAHQLYEKLVAPVAGQLTEEVIVVPDGVLGYVPFEALLTRKPAREGAFSSYPYLLKERQISYCYSATLLREMKQKQHRQPPAKSVLAMAPFFQGDTIRLKERVISADLLAQRDSLGSLKGSGEEVVVVSKLLNGTSLYGGQASLEKFRQEAGSHRILHLSTHGKADDRQGDYAYLAFGVPGDSTAFEKLYARDLYNYSLNADLVVLSACETGIGKLRKGEGIVSLARAFAYAGAKSIFTTLWQVSDAKTAELMRDFYKNLSKGNMDKDAALRQAKLDYLKRNKGEYNHPFYWAAMIGIGDMRAIK